MKIYKCDHCDDDIRPKASRFRVAVCAPTAQTGLAEYPKIPYGSYDFCSKDCLLGWLEDTRVCRATFTGSEAVGKYKCIKPLPHIYHDWQYTTDG